MRCQADIIPFISTGSLVLTNLLENLRQAWCCSPSRGQLAATLTSISRVKNNWKSMEMNCMTVGVREGNNMSEICNSWSGLALFFWYLYLCVVFIQQIFPQFSCFSSGVFSPHFWCVKQNFSDNFHILIIVVTCWVMAGTDQNIDHHQQYNLSEPPQGLGH